MLKQFPSSFNASRLATADKRDETSVVCANRILHAGTHCALSCGDGMTQAFTHMLCLCFRAGQWNANSATELLNALHRVAQLVTTKLPMFCHSEYSARQVPCGPSTHTMSTQEDCSGGLNGAVHRPQWSSASPEETPKKTDFAHSTLKWA